MESQTLQAGGGFLFSAEQPPDWFEDILYREKPRGLLTYALYEDGINKNVITLPSYYFNKFELIK